MDADYPQIWVIIARRFTCITGVTRTFGSLDYLRVSCAYTPETWTQTLAQFGQQERWHLTAGGKLGYSRQACQGHITIYYDDDHDTLCVDIAGQGCRQLERMLDLTHEQDWQAFLSQLMATGYCFTRVDFAFDDQAGWLDMDTIQQCVATKGCVSRFHYLNDAEKKRLSSNRRVGKELQFGSRQSDYRLRFYDKAAERREAGMTSVPSKLVRMEVEAKNTLAERLVAAFVEEGLAAVLNDVSARIRFTQPGTSGNRRRWPTCAWWSGFLGERDKIRIQVNKTETPLAKMAANIERQYGWQLAQLLDSPDYGLDWLGGATDRARKRHGIGNDTEGELADLSPLPQAKERKPMNPTERFLREVLKDGPVPSTQVDRLALERGISIRTVSRVRTRLNIPCKRVPFGKSSYWIMSLPQPAEEEATGAELDNTSLANVADVNVPPPATGHLEEEAREVPDPLVEFRDLLDAVRQPDFPNLPLPMRDGTLQPLRQVVLETEAAICAALNECEEPLDWNSAPFSEWRKLLRHAQATWDYYC